MMGVTAKQAACLSAIRKLTRDGVPPTLDQLRAELAISSKGQVHKLLVELKERGHVDWTPYRAQSLRILAPEITGSDLKRFSDAALDRLHTAIGLELDRRARCP